MSNQMPIYSQIVPKSQYKKNNKKSQNRTDFDPLNFNNGGNFPTGDRIEKIERSERKEDRKDERREERRGKEDRRKEDANRSKRGQKTETSEGKVEAYLRQYQVSIRQHQHRHAATRQPDHRLNLRSLPLNEVTSARGHDRTPTDRHRGFPERERDGRDHRRERDRDRDNFEFDGTPLSPIASRTDKDRVRKSSSSQRVSEGTMNSEKRKFYCREWAFQKIAHCLEQRPVSKTCGAFIIGDAGSGKTALCRELSAPGGGAQARQQRALNRRLLAHYFLQGSTESSLRPGELVRSLAMQILSHSSREPRLAADTDLSPQDHRRDSDEERLVERFRDLADDGEESSKPLLADSEDRTDSEDGGRRGRTIDRIHEREQYQDMQGLRHDLPEILPRTSIKQNNPFATDDKDDQRLYENHENLFLRNISSRQSKEGRNSRLTRQSSEPLNEKKVNILQKSLSTETKEDLISNSSNFKDIPHSNSSKDVSTSNLKDMTSNLKDSPPKSRIPVANFRYPNKSDLKSAENSPKKNDKLKEEVEYQNVINDLDEANDNDINDNNCVNEVDEEAPSPRGDAPPPIPSLPVSPRTLIANAYYDKLLQEQEIQQALLPQNLEKNPDECFKKALLFPLLEIDPPKHCLFLLVDGIDEGNVNVEEPESSPSSSVATLLARHQHLLPQWLLLVCTARPKPKRCSVYNLFTGFRKISLDELTRAHVAADVQRYVLARLDAEPRLRARVSSDASAAAAAAAALDHLRIKSDGCLLYLEKVLDGVADGFIALREIREIPGTLNGLYLWLAQRLFHGRRFNKVRLLLEVLLAARCGVTEEMLYRCLLTRESGATRDDFHRRMHLLRRVLVVSGCCGYVRVFHASFAAWLTDVKHCTRRYLCAPGDGHAALAMYHTLLAHRLSALEIHNYVYHMIYLEQHLAEQKKNKNTEPEEGLDRHTLTLLWILDSGCDVESALRREPEILLTQIDKQEENDGEPESEGKDSSSGAQSLARLMPALAGAWPRDVRVQRALLEMTRHQAHNLLPVEEPIIEKPLPIEEPSDLSMLEPNTLLDIVSRGDEETLARTLKRFPTLVEQGVCVEALHVAARGGRAGCVLALLRAGAAPDAPDADGWSPLRAAAWAGHVEVVDVLLEFGCDVDCVDADNRTALRAAAWSGHGGVVRRLLAAGAAPERADGEGRTALLAAAYMGHDDIVRQLLRAGAGVHTADHDGRTALSVASLCGGGAACCALLLERGACVNHKDRDRATPLLVAAFEGHTDICELLLEAEADIEAVDSLGRTALWAAAAAGHAATVRLLLFWGACVDNMDAEGRTVLSIAAAQGNVEVVRQLLDRGLDEHHRDNSGWTPLHYAAFEGHIEVCEALLEAGAKVDETDNDGKGALLLAAQEGHTALVEVLADRWQAPVDQHAHDGKTALRLAALEGHFSCVRALHARGADVDAADADRRTTLYVLALDNRLAMARYLLHHCGAAVDVPDTEGRTPLHVSAWQGHAGMVRALVGAGARVEARDGAARTALHAAAWRGRADALKTLLALGATPDALCTQGATPLGIAAQEGHEECVMWLLQYGADPLQADHCGRTPAKVAWRAGHANICRLLERCAAQQDSQQQVQQQQQQQQQQQHAGSPECKRRSVHSSGSTRSSGHTAEPREPDHEPHDAHEKPSRAHLSLSFAQQVARVGRGRRDKDRDSIPENSVPEKESKLSASNRSYTAHERDRDILGYACERDRRREERHGAAGDASPLYASPPRSPLSDICSPMQAFGPQPPSQAAPALTDTHFNRDTHMRIILGRESKQHDRHDSKNKRNGIVTNPAMRLVANVRNGLDSAAANIRRTGVALAASASSANPAVKTNAFQWRKETPL